MGWEVWPEELPAILRRVHADYGPKRMYITENGAAFDDAPGEDGRVHDTRRRDFLRGHLDAARRACEEGIPLRGYFLWSLLDNYEWAGGYSSRFGIVHVDYETQTRTPKGSYRAFQGMLHNTR